jgi:hypothetical protein
VCWTSDELSRFLDDPPVVHRGAFMAPTNSRISFTVHRSAWLVIAVFIAFGFRDLGFPNGVLGGFLIVVSLLIHEPGHATAAVLFDVPVYGIGLNFVGAYIHRKYASRPIHDVIIAASGPLASLFLTVSVPLRSEGRRMAGRVEFLYCCPEPDPISGDGRLPDPEDALLARPNHISAQATRCSLTSA